MSDMPHTCTCARTIAQQDEKPCNGQRGELAEFLCILRVALLQIVRWIEKRYPESVK